MVAIHEKFFMYCDIIREKWKIKPWNFLFSLLGYSLSPIKLHSKGVLEAGIDRIPEPC